ncbi:cupin domain-containing protein [Mesorhizobium sp. M7A.F.Ca.US.006.04.2.1]|uniref:cupin domain-containing protein n=1 Tax=unclassified Mesorhizobium TaxID=325217 RepID=UPI000FCC0BDF|nr:MULTISPECIES: cupin domain-containing protein [unclassified Mesorhizobium]RUX76897.1 cupin domain-containing protein [Mesorhizobium sp. M7A.F.Ca.US.005.03.1.1]RUY11177.1 cupin domain-containing protein [Mesorhizobium sp. M7A.F.Ca.US.005.03.2.1]RVA81340.1 cupin domain-containing protein [Mesorhizobium sp. M7A.F.Ca.US.006.04.2.1]
MSAAPTIPYWHLWTDADGISRQTRCALTEFELRSIKPPADPQWQGLRSNGRMTTLVTILPVGWTGTWHENPKPQWIVPLSGRWFVQSMDGVRVEMGPGELSFGGDQNCREVDGRRGHRSGTVGDEPAALIVVQLHDALAPSLPCEFR